MFGRDHKVRSLAHVPMLRSCTAVELRALAALGDECSVRSGEVLCAAGSTRPEFLILLEGEAQTSVGDRLVPGDSHGAAEALAGMSSREEVRMLTDGSVVVFGPRELAGVIRRAPNFALALARTLATR